MLMMITPEISVANTAGFLKGMSAIRNIREYLQVERNSRGGATSGPGYCVSTVKLDEQLIRAYYQEP